MTGTARFLPDLEDIDMAPSCKQGLPLASPENRPASAFWPEVTTGSVLEGLLTCKRKVKDSSARTSRFRRNLVHTSLGLHRHDEGDCFPTRFVVGYNPGIKIDRESFERYALGLILSDR